MRTIESLHQDVDYSHIHDMLQKEKEKNKSKLFAEMKAQKTNMIPLKVFKNIVSLAVRDIKDETLGWKSKICACLVVILSETGMRVEELALLERGKLREIKLGDEREVTYLEFKVFKNQTNSAEGFKNTISFASDVCAFAYRELEKISESAIDELPSHQYHQLILGLKGIWIRQNKKGWKRMIKKRREAFNLLDEIEIETLDREAKKYLFINLEKGKATFNDPSGSFRRNLYKFFFRHRDDLKLQELGKNSLCKIKTKMLSAENETDKFIMNIESEKNSPNKYKKYDGSILYYVSPHQFRVTVCTKLMLEGVQLDFIRSHMNHLTEDITMGYSRCDEFTDPLEEGREILQEMADREGLLNTNPEEATDDFIKSDLSKAKTDYEAINKFLKKNKLNIVKDIDDLIKMVKRTNSPLLETEIGFCAWNAIHAICERRQYFSSVKDFYHIGVKIPSLKTLSISYKRFLEKQTIVKHNKTIADKDSKYKLEYDRERKALQKYIEKTLLPELKIAKEKIDELGIVSFLELYPDLKFIACRIDEILAKEVNVWTA